MKLSYEQIKAITLGAERVEQTSGGVSLSRFNEREEAAYRPSERFYLRSLSSSGICLSFSTDSRFLTLGVTVSPGGSRTYYSFDLFVNGKMTDRLSNLDPKAPPRNYTELSHPLGNAEKTFSLGEGEKQIALYLPFSTKTVLRELSLDDHASVTPIKPKKRLLCYGDSITQGYDVLSPSCKYTTRLARYLGAEEINKGIGGALFFPALAEAASELSPDLITVAYGTNDWSALPETDFTENCDGFLSRLSARYPETETLVLTPIWRKDHTDRHPLGRFSRAGEIISACAERHPQMRVIDGFDLVPHDEALFGDLSLHPNDEGFSFYFENLVKKAGL